ncbi:dTDP-4-dehydrorhamnose reductase [Oceanospirillum linum]|uniref:dTDP-4-dehydrorhamnose reductase n=1 Tax=Oceanospirillum linum TaxID=966 RepID=A0A1T1HAX5_OCELI|nr:dTDP-4-dehydrorhamnose reductase [Oceanospirillum linum]OOV86975.1 dTDP-4-dehydrorhamnose reductase [Oceanospirillum linum]SEF70231.1 dTDP-4-dehydrorhamnose reductase [Oleiphilus messinensis]SMP15230.1 dTDP-4-dehydrorhamnose reductase [Oceanospirillum linum]
MVKILITGANGQVGRSLVEQAPATVSVSGSDREKSGDGKIVQLLACSSSELDITQADRVKAVMEQFQPDLIINAAAYTAVDKAETESDQAYAVNRDGVLNLAQEAKQRQIPVLHISTDYVFDGEKDTPYKETDSTSPESVYGASKLAGEQALQQSGALYLILRTSWVFGVHGGNFVKTMLRLAGERDTLSIVADQQGAPTSAASIAETLWRFARQYFGTGNLESGVYHFSNQPETTWHGFATEIFTQAYGMGLLEKQPVVQGITTAEYPTPAKRPLNSRLDCTKIQRTLSIEIPQWQDELSRVLAKLQNES